MGNHIMDQGGLDDGLPQIEFMQLIGRGVPWTWRPRNANYLKFILPKE